MNAEELLAAHKLKTNPLFRLEVGMVLRDVLVDRAWVVADPQQPRLARIGCGVSLNGYAAETVLRDPDVLPDLASSATQGCLLALIRHHSGGRLVEVFSDYPDHWEHQWTPLSGDDRLGDCPYDSTGHATYGLALASALGVLATGS